MSHKKNNSISILVTASIIALALVATTSFNYSYTAFAVSEKTGSSKSDNGLTTLGGASSSSSAKLTSNTLTKKELSSLVSCINAANKSEGLTHKVVTNCLDTARGITSAAATSTTTSSSSPSLAPSVSSKSSPA